MWFYKVSFENEHLDYFIESIKGFFSKLLKVVVLLRLLMASF